VAEFPGRHRPHIKVAAGHGAQGLEINDVHPTRLSFSRAAPTFGCGRKAKNDIVKNLLKGADQGRVILVALRMRNV
jgi:hypothetical protein